MIPAAGRAVLLALIGVFALPGVLAWIFYVGIGWHGQGGAAQGHLVVPSLALPDTPLQAREDGAVVSDKSLFVGHWTLLQILPTACDKACRGQVGQGLAAGRQVRALLHDKAPRVQRRLLVGDNAALKMMPDLQPDVSVYRTKVVDWLRLSAGYPAKRPGTIWLIDPAGRWMAFYPPPGQAAALHHDITRLLALPSRF